MDLKRALTAELEAELQRRRDEGEVVDLIPKIGPPEGIWKVTTEGIWKVTTEGDCEARTSKNLGVWEGHVADIAAQLAGKEMYKLSFKRVALEKNIIGPIKKPCTIDIDLDIESGTWDLSRRARAKTILEWLKFADPEVTEVLRVDQSNYYAAVKLTVVPKET